MTGNVTVDPEALRAAASRATDLQGRVAEIVDTLTSTLQSHGAPWGDDHYGREFAEGDNGYLAVHKNLISGGQTMVTSLSDLATGQNDAADSLQGTDRASAQGLNGR